MNDKQHRGTARELLGDGSKSEGTREKLLHVSIELFYRHGVHAVGLDRILKEVGTTKTTFYKYFESRDDLIYEALQTRDTWELEWFHNAIRSADKIDAASSLLAIFEVLNLWFTDSRFQGFQFMNAAAQFPMRSDPIHKLARKHLTALQSLLVDSAETAGVPSPETLGRRLLLLVEGAFAVRYVMGDDAAACTGRELAELAVQDSLR